MHCDSFWEIYLSLMVTLATALLSKTRWACNLPLSCFIQNSRSVYVCVCVCVCVCVQVCVCVYVYVFMYMYLYIYMYLCICTVKITPRQVSGECNLFSLPKNKNLC